MSCCEIEFTFVYCYSDSGVSKTLDKLTFFLKKVFGCISTPGSFPRLLEGTTSSNRVVCSTIIASEQYLVRLKLQRHPDIKIHILKAFYRDLVPNKSEEFDDLALYSEWVNLLGFSKERLQHA